jgi:hypothetical protein
MADYPVAFSVQRPETFDRTQVVLRILVLLILSIFAYAIGWISGIVYLAVPIIAAILISQKGGEEYHKDKGGPVLMLLRWYFAIYCYFMLLTDRFPTENPEQHMTFDVAPTGSPTVGSALLRLIFSIPSAIVVGLLGVVGFVIAIIAVISILIQEKYSEGLYDFQAGIMRWQARLMGYHASFVDQYPPFALDTGQDGSAYASAVDASPAATTSPDAATAATPPESAPPAPEPSAPPEGPTQP